MTSSLRGFTRRGFARLCAALLPFGTVRLRAAEDPPLTWAALPELSNSSERQYRADAQILLLSIPVLHRKGVGDGSAAWRESPPQGGVVLRLLEFTGRSAPEHAAGLNRFGFIRELSRNVERVRTEAIYFGLMTSSPEETAAEARKALHSNSKEASYSVIEGRIAPGLIETRGARFIAASNTSPAERNQLVERARQALSTTSNSKSEWPSNQPTPPPFLHALGSLLDRSGPSESRYAYAGHLYRLRVEKAPDPKAAVLYRDRHLIPPAATVTRVSGTLRREEGGKPSEFRLWIEDGALRPIPLRIEYQPKSYLRLTFEVDG